MRARDLGAIFPYRPSRNFYKGIVWSWSAGWVSCRRLEYPTGNLDGLADRQADKLSGKNLLPPIIRDFHKTVRHESIRNYVHMRFERGGGGCGFLYPSEGGLRGTTIGGVISISGGLREAYDMETGCQDSHPWKIEQEKLVRQQQFTVA